MKLLAFAASHRKESTNRKLVRFAADMAVQQGASVEFVEYGALDMPIYDQETYKAHALPEALNTFVAHLRRVDGMLIASPEYNWSYPGSLKNIIDWASVVAPNPFAGKTLLLLSASPSLRGGAQGLIHLKVPFEALGAFPFPRIFTLARAEEMFNGGHTLEDARLKAELAQLVTDFLAMTNRLMHR
jgi:NAD(P)H-dependent FMN reductase